MKKLVLFVLWLDSLAAACGGKIEVSEENMQPVPSVAADSGTEVGYPDAPSPETGCLSQVKVKVTGPPDFTIFPGYDRQMFLHIRLVASDCLDVAVDEIVVLVRSLSGGAACVGDCGEPEKWNFRDAKVAYAAGDLVGASALYKADDGAGRIVFNYPNFSPAGKTIDLHIAFDIAADEVESGTLYGQTFQVVLESVGASQAKHPDTIDLALPAQSGVITVTKPQAAYCEPWSDDDPTLEFGYRGCCGQFQDDSGWPNVGELFKGSLPPVYYYGSDGKRYVFTTSVVLDSWYGVVKKDGVTISDSNICTRVKQSPDETLALIPLGGNVTLRPGVYVTGITTDPKRYVISRGHELHWLESDAIGEQIYPGTYEARIRRVPDAFFANYVVGMSYSYGGQYDLGAALAVTLEQDLGIVP